MKINLIILLILGIWLGLIIGISFLEAPLKFKAPNMTITLGLGIGKLVFNALNKIEIIFSGILFLWLILKYTNLEVLTISCLISLIILVLLQSFWLLPVLNTRVDNLISGVKLVNSNHHFYYVGAELLKVFLLLYGFTKIYSHE